LRFEDLQLREGHWVIADLRGKGGHIRTIPVPEWVKEAIYSWTLGAGINSGSLLRSINKAGRIWGHGFTPKVIWTIVKLNAKNSSLPTVAPHDLRRTCAIKQAANWSRFSFCWVTSPSRRRNDT
jgi:integrase